MFLGSKARPTRKADNLTAICERIVQKMWDPPRLTTPWTFTVCCTDKLYFFILTVLLSYLRWLFVWNMHGSASGSCSVTCLG
jgi:hypothetical protein